MVVRKLFYFYIKLVIVLMFISVEITINTEDMSIISMSRPQETEGLLNSLHTIFKLIYVYRLTYDLTFTVVHKNY